MTRLAITALLLLVACGGPSRNSSSSHAIDPDEDDVHWAKERPRAVPGEPSDTPRSVRFGAGALVVGTQIERRAGYVGNLDGIATSDSDELAYGEERRTQSTIALEVLAVDGDGASEVRATIREARAWSSADPDAPEQLAIEGRRVIIARSKDGAISVRADDRAALSADDREAIIAEIGDVVGEWAPADLPLLPLGETVRVPAGWRVVEGATDDAGAGALTARLQSIDMHDGREVALVVLRGTRRSTPRPQAVLEFEGEVRVLADVVTGWPIEVTMEGPTSLDERRRENGRTIHFQGSGDSRATFTYTYNAWP